MDKKELQPVESKLDGYPPEFYRRLRHWRSRAILALGGTATAAVFIDCQAVFGNWDFNIAVIATVIFLIWGVFFNAMPLLRHEYTPERASKYAKIAPYFERAVPGRDTLWGDSAKCLARNFRRLETLAVAASALPLSAFGFADDFPEPQRVWHEPEQGLVSVASILVHLRNETDTEFGADLECVMGGLEGLEVRLQEASRLGVRFCLHLRIDFAVTGLEFERRQGEYEAIGCRHAPKKL